MDRLLPDMQIFVAVGRARNFGRAAAALGVPSSTVSRRIKVLEESLGIRLLNRSPRQVELTDDGEKYLRRIEHIVDDALLAHEEIRDDEGEPNGHIRVSIPHGVATERGFDWIAQFGALHPAISFEINTDPKYVDLISDRFDIALRHGPLPNSRLNVRRLGAFERRLYATPDYLAKYGTPQTPADLEQHECIRHSDSPNSWTLERGAEAVTVNVKGRFFCESLTSGRFLLRNGLGIGQAAPDHVETARAAGTLIQVLPGWIYAPQSFYVITPTRHMPRRVRLLVDYVLARMNEISV